MKTSDDGIIFIKNNEGVRLKAYKAVPTEKYWTIGYGHSGSDVTEGMVITAERAEELLKSDLARFERYVERYCTIPLTENRNAALVSYTYNRGPGGMRQLSENCKTVDEYSEGLIKYWGRAKRYKDALIRRRKAEKALFDKDR